MILPSDVPTKIAGHARQKATSAQQRARHALPRPTRHAARARTCAGLSNRLYFDTGRHCEQPRELKRIVPGEWNAVSCCGGSRVQQALTCCTRLLFLC